MFADGQTAEPWGVFSSYPHLSALVKFCSLESLVCVLWFTWSSCENSSSCASTNLLLPLSINYSGTGQLGMNNSSSKCQNLVNNLMQLRTNPNVSNFVAVKIETLDVCVGGTITIVLDFVFQLEKEKMIIFVSVFPQTDFKNSGPPRPPSSRLVSL